MITLALWYLLIGGLCCLFLKPGNMTNQVMIIAFWPALFIGGIQIKD